MAAFHRKCGDRVILTNNNKTAVRNFSEFNNGIVLSSEPLLNNSLFQVKIEKAINSWSGSIEIGVISCDPENIELPASATELKQGCWILSGTSVLQDGRSSGDEAYGTDLDKLNEGDLVGVMRTDKGELKFFINGETQGVAAKNIPEKVYAIVDLYGRCAQVSIIPPDHSEDGNTVAADWQEEPHSQMLDLVNNLSLNMNIPPSDVQIDSCGSDRLRFHARHGILVKLSCNSRTAERLKPLDEFNNGVVMTHRPLRDNELFEIRIDRLVDKWSGSIEVGVTTHNPNKLEFPATMTNMRSGTTIMSGCGILTNGKGTRREYGEFNLDELQKTGTTHPRKSHTRRFANQLAASIISTFCVLPMDNAGSCLVGKTSGLASSREGDRIGMMRKSNGNLHYFINGLDQDVAAEKVPETVWGVVDLYGMTVKVTIVDRDEREEQNLMTRRNTEIRESQTVLRTSNLPENESSDRLVFHPKCGTHAAVINNGRTVHRPNAMDDFNNGVALTNRPLKPNEIFEIRLDKMVTKWAGSIEIGVTTHSPNDLEYPSTMTNVRSGTWMMTGNGVMHNGSTIIDEYGHNLDRLKVGDRVGATRKESGSLHFYVNGVDQGVAAVNVPDSVYGVIDLYGQAAQATLIDVLDYSPDTDNSSLSNTTLYSDLRFYHVHGRNARVFNNGLTASRTRTLGEFNHAVVITNRPLKDSEMFEVKIETLVDRWSGSIEAGVTVVRPEEFDFPSTLTDMDHGTWMLSGSSVMKDGFTLKSGYPCDLDTLPVGTRIGLMRSVNGTLHYFINGLDQGPACENIPAGVHAVIDLYGQCAQVSIINSTERASNPVANTLLASECILNPSQIPLEITHSLSTCCGKNIVLENCNTVASRSKNYSHGLVFSAHPLESDEYFEVCLTESCKQWSGSLHIGVSTIPVSESLQPANLPPVISGISFETWYLAGSDIKKNSSVIKTNYCPSLEWLTPGHKVGVRRTIEGFLKFTLDGSDLGVAASRIPKKVYAVVDVFGSATKISVTSMKQQVPYQGVIDSPLVCSRSQRLQESLDAFGESPATPTASRIDFGVDYGGGGEAVATESPDTFQNPVPFQGQGDDVAESFFSLSEHHGRNIKLSDRRLGAKRVASYNQAVVISQKPLQKGFPFQVRIEKINPDWACGLAFGVTSMPSSSVQCSVNALALKENSWIVFKDCVFKNGKKIRNGYGIGKLVFTVGTVIKILIDHESHLRIFLNDCDLGVAASGLPSSCYAVVDLNGRCEEISVVHRQCESDAGKTSVSATERQESQQEKADLEIQEKYPEQQTIETPEKNLKTDVKRRHSKELTKTEQKLTSSDSYNSGIQQISSHAASCSFQTDTDNYNSQIQQLTVDLRSDLSRSLDSESTPMTLSDTYNTELQMLSAQSNSQMNLDDLNIQIQQLSSSNSGGDISLNLGQNLTRSQSQPFSNKSARASRKDDEKGDENKDSINCLLEISSPNAEPEEEESINECNTDEKTEIQGHARNSSKIILPKGRRQAPSAKLHNASSQNLRKAVHNARRRCDYFTSCLRFKNMLGLPDGFFSKEPGTCFCDKCYQVDAVEETYKMKGDPPTEYSIPMGWSKFPLKKHPGATDKIDTWQVAFYGTQPGSIRRILDHGELVMPSLLGMEKTTLKAKEDETDNSHIVFSPSIKYAACDYFVSKFEFVEPRFKTKSEATFAFQILVQPGSYKVGPPSVDVPKEFDPRFERDATEWVTKERGATILSALLVKVEGSKIK